LRRLHVNNTPPSGTRFVERFRLACSKSLADADASPAAPSEPAGTGQKPPEPTSNESSDGALGIGSLLLQEGTRPDS
jgi:hypothetical protein